MAEVRTGEIIGEAVRLAGAARIEVILYVAVLTAFGTATDVMETGTGMWMVYNIISLALGFAVVVAMVRKSRLAIDGSRGFGTYFGIAILSASAFSQGSSR